MKLSEMEEINLLSSRVIERLNCFDDGAHNWTRTSDSYLVEVILYQLSYASILKQGNFTKLLLKFI